MSQAKLDRLESIIDRLDEGEDQISAEELREIAADLETGKQYRCATCAMYCTGEDIMVIYDTEKKEFIQIEVPMDDSQPLTITRVS